MIHIRQERGILVAHYLPIDAVHVRRVKEVAHLAPGFVINLLPFHAPVGHDVEAFQLELVILRFELLLWQVDDRVLLFDLHQHLFPIKADLVSVHIAQDGFFPVLQVIETEMPFQVFGAAVFFAGSVAHRAP